MKRSIQTADIADGAFAITECIVDSVTQATILGGLVEHPSSIATKRRCNRLKGELILMRDDSSGAETEGCFQRAIDITRKQSAKSLELRATMSLAWLLNKQGRRDEARAMLADIYSWFTEGFDTADLKDAKALFDELAR